MKRIEWEYTLDDEGSFLHLMLLDDGTIKIDGVDQDPVSISQNDVEELGDAIQMIIARRKSK